MNDPLSILSSRKELDSTRFGYLLEENRKLYGIDSVFPEDSDGWVDEKNMALWIPIADGNRRDGVGDLLEVQGIVSERHRKNPVVLFDHGKQVTLPIAMACERNDDGQYDRSKYTFQIDANERNARLNAYFYQGKGMAGVERGKEYDHALFTEQLFDMVAKRMLGAGSIGYQVIKSIPLQPDYSAGTPEGVHLLKILMLEGSLVVMPANMDTVQKCLAMPMICGKPISPYLVKSLTPHAGPKKVQMGYEAKADNSWKKGDVFEYFGEVWKVIKTNKDGSIDAAKPHMDQFGKEMLIGLKSFPRFEANGPHLKKVSGYWFPQPGLAKAKSLDDTETKPAEKSIKELRQKYKAVGNSFKPGDKVEIVDGFYGGLGWIATVVRIMPDGEVMIHVDGRSPDIPVPPEDLKKKSLDVDNKAAPNKVSFPSARRQRAGIDDTFRPGDTVTARIQLNEPGNINADPIARPGDRLKIVSVNPDGLNMIVERNGRQREVTVSSVRKSLEVTQTKGISGLKGVLHDISLSVGHHREPLNITGSGSRATAESLDADYIRKLANALRDASEGWHVTVSKNGDYSIVTVTTKSLTQTKSLDLGEVRKKYRTGKNLRRRLKRSSPGASVICVGKKDVDAVEEMAKDKGLKATQLGTADGETRIKLIGDDASADEVAKAFGRPIGVKAMKLDGPTGEAYKRSQLKAALRRRIQLLSSPTLDQRPADKAKVEEWKRQLAELEKPTKSLNGKHKSMDEDTELGAVETNSLDADTGSSEPWGAQVLRKFHADHSAMMKDYDELLGPLEHEGVKSHVTKHLQNIEKALSETEKMWGKHYKDLPGLEGVDAGEESAEDDNGLVEEELEGEEKDADTMDDNANPADSTEPEVPSPEEVLEGMDGTKGDEELDQEMKSLRHKYRMKTMGKSVCPKCDGEPCKCKKALINHSPQKGDIVILRDGRTAYVLQSGPTLLKVQFQDTPTTYNGEKRSIMKGEVVGKKSLSAKKKSTEVPVPHGDMSGTDVPPATFEPGVGAKLLPHHKTAVGEAAGFLKEIGAPGSQFDDEERMKSFHYHKTLDGMQQVAGDEAGTKSEPGSPEWAAEEANEPEHKGGDAFGEGDVPAENENGAAGSSDMFKTIGEASETFKRFSQEKAFGDPHRDEANKMCKALEGITNAPDEEQKDDEAMSEDAIDPATEPGEMGQKGFTRYTVEIREGGQWVPLTTENDPREADRVMKQAKRDGMQARVVESEKSLPDDEMEKMLKKLKEDNEEQDKRMKSLTRKFLSLNGTK